ncbi:zinc finger protein squeeze [Drosophila elegans]|uniref:zinc finger protein squeeze n=1 Tax=Drosophila elegans TaxID=30023 RepID=UPI0007E7F612|nr:zinc finger protein squeeze [Drosophila elegans]
MSGKLIMKRKRASQEEQQQQHQQQQAQEQHIPEQQQHQPEEPAPEKRHRPLTPPAEEEPAQDYPSPAESPNRILLEALQKIMELQAELDAFEHDLDERDGYAGGAAGAQDEDAVESAEEDAEVAAQFAPPTPGQRSQAEALGFAMCARETLLFLQSEGIPTESPLYQTLLGKLVGQSDGLLHA